MKRRHRASKAIASVVIVVLGYIWFRWENPYTSRDAPAGAQPNWPELANQFVGEKGAVARIFDGATKVEAFRISDGEDWETPDDSSKAKALNRKISGFPVFAVGPVLKPNFAKELGTLLLNPKNYTSPGQDPYSCLLAPGVAYRVWKEKEFVDVIICFNCGELMVIEQDPSVALRNMGGYQTRYRVGGSFEPMWPQLVKLCKRVFVKDRGIQALRPAIK